jgi:nucleotide-binding universal stress UspA family protein
MFKKILFATTASPTCDNAAKVAFDLELKWEAKLFVFHVFGIPGRGYSTFVTDARTGEEIIHDEDYVAWVLEEMKNTYAKQLEQTDNVVVETTHGVPHVEILRKARKENIDLIIMGAHTREEDVGATRFRSVVGSTMQRVAKSARCPVVIVSRPCTTCWRLFSNIVVGTDFSKASDSAFLFGYKLAKEVGAKLHLFHACDINVADYSKVKSQQEIENMVLEAREKMEARYGAKLKGFDDFDVDIWEGIPYVEILKFARDKEADLIVMAHHTKEIDPEKALLGSTVEQVVLRATQPVASVSRPDKVADILI